MVKGGNLALITTLSNIDNGLYFGKKNSFVDNKNIFISGMTNDDNLSIKWQITKL